MEFLTNFIYDPNTEFLGQLLLAAFLGALVGIERELAKKTAGMRTFAFVSLGSALFSIISIHALEWSGATGVINFDPTRIAAQIVAGVGFIGAGLIIFNDSKLQGVTTASGLWLASAIGMAIGFRFYLIGIFTAFVTIFIFTFLWSVEERVLKKYSTRTDDD